MKMRPIVNSDESITEDRSAKIVRYSDHLSRHPKEQISGPKNAQTEYDLMQNVAHSTTYKSNNRHNALHRERRVNDVMENQSNLLKNFKQTEQKHKGVDTRDIDYRYRYRPKSCCVILILWCARLCRRKKKYSKRVLREPTRWFLEKIKEQRRECRDEKSDIVASPIITDVSVTPYREPIIENRVREPIIENRVREPITENRVREPSVQEPSVQESIIREPIIREPIIREPIVREPITREPNVREPNVREPITREPNVQEPIVREPSVREPIIREPIIRESSVQEPSVSRKIERDRKQNDDEAEVEVVDKDMFEKIREERKKRERKERDRRERRERRKWEERRMSHFIVDARLMETRDEDVEVSEDHEVSEKPPLPQRITDFTKTCCYLCAQNALTIATARTKPEQSDKCVQVSNHKFQTDKISPNTIDRSCSPILIQIRTVQSFVKVRTRETNTLCPGTSVRRRKEIEPRSKKRKKFNMFLGTWTRTKCPARRHAVCQTDKIAIAERDDNAEKREPKNEKCCREKNV